jgi:hypothetical protein
MIVALLPTAKECFACRAHAKMNCRPWNGIVNVLMAQLTDTSGSSIKCRRLLHRPQT